jgi:hypothetical protein
MMQQIVLSFAIVNLLIWTPYIVFTFIKYFLYRDVNLSEIDNSTKVLLQISYILYPTNAFFYALGIYFAERNYKREKTLPETTNAKISIDKITTKLDETTDFEKSVENVLDKNDTELKIDITQSSEKNVISPQKSLESTDLIIPDVDSKLKPQPFFILFYPIVAIQAFLFAIYAKIKVGRHSTFV